MAAISQIELSASNATSQVERSRCTWVAAEHLPEPFAGRGVAECHTDEGEQGADNLGLSCASRYQQTEPEESAAARPPTTAQPTDDFVGASAASTADEITNNVVAEAQQTASGRAHLTSRL